MLLTPIQVSNVLDKVEQQFGHVVGRSWTASTIPVACLPDGGTALSNRLSIWNGSDTYLLDCNNKSCSLSKLVFEKREGWGMPFIWGCAQQVPDASRFASSYIGDVTVDGGSMNQGQSDGDVQAGQDLFSGDTCTDGFGQCYADANQELLPDSILPKDVADIVDAAVGQDSNQPSSDVCANDICYVDSKADVAEVVDPCDPNGDGDVSDTIADPVLRNVIKTALNKDVNQKVSYKEAQALTTLNAKGDDVVKTYGAKIKSLTGLECFPNISGSILLENNAVEDIGPLALLKGVQYLYLKGNKITKVPSFPGSQLKGIELQGNQLAGALLLAGLQYLEKLDVSGNKLTSLDGLKDLPSLKDLYADNNQLTAAPKLQLPNLKHLRLEHNQIPDVLDPTGLPSLVDLYLGYNNLTDMAPFTSGFGGLLILSLPNNKVKEVPVLSGLMQLQTLILSNNGIQKISPPLSPNSLKSLSNLYLAGNALTDISALAVIMSVVQFQQLMLGDNQLQNVEVLGKLACGKNGCQLNLENNGLTDITPLIQNPAFKDSTVWLKGNAIPKTQIDELKKKGVAVFF